MPAQTPREVHELFAEHFSAGDLDELMSVRPERCDGAAGWDCA